MPIRAVMMIDREKQPAARSLSPEPRMFSRLAVVGALERGYGAHEGGFTGPVGAQQPEHAVVQGQADIVDGAYAVGISLGQRIDG